VKVWARAVGSAAMIAAVAALVKRMLDSEIDVWSRVDGVSRVDEV
jgi:hypothetical protein